MTLELRRSFEKSRPNFIEGETGQQVTCRPHPTQWIRGGPPPLCHSAFSYPQLLAGAVLSPRGTFGQSLGDSLVVRKGECHFWHLVGRPECQATSYKPPTNTTTKNYPSPKTAVVVKLRNPGAGGAGSLSPPPFSTHPLMGSFLYSCRAERCSHFRVPLLLLLLLKQFCYIYLFIYFWL